MIQARLVIMVPGYREDFPDMDPTEALAKVAIRMIKDTDESQQYFIAMMLMVNLEAIVFYGPTLALKNMVRVFDAGSGTPDIVMGPVEVLGNAVIH